MTAVYRGMDAATVEAQYQPSLRVPSLQPFMEAYRVEGERARATVAHERLAYGEHPDEWLWYFPAPQPGAPLLVFIHGGYWRRLSADDGCYLAPAAQRLGLALASVNYTLCPGAPLATLVDQTQRALGRLLETPSPQHGRSGLDHDRGRVHVAGHSAGAHLGAMATVAGLPLAGTILVSGIFDITPIVHTTINDDVRLDGPEAARLSPMSALDGVGDPRLRQIVTWSGLDTEEFARQGLEWAERWSATPGNRPPTVVTVADRNHFDIVFDLLDPGRVLGRAVIDQVLGGGPDTGG